MVTKEEYNSFVNEYDRTHKTDHTVSPARREQMIEEAAKREGVSKEQMEARLNQAKRNATNNTPASQRTEGPSEARLRAERDASYFRWVEGRSALTNPSDALQKAERDASYFRWVEEYDRTHKTDHTVSPARREQMIEEAAKQEGASKEQIEARLNQAKRSATDNTPAPQKQEKSSGTKSSLKKALEERSVLPDLHNHHR